MTDLEFLTSLIAEVGTRDDDIAGVLRTSPNSWLVRFADVDVEIEHQASRDRLVFASVIGPTLAGNREAVLEALLCYGFLWRQTGGMRMALTEPGGDVLQLFDLEAARIDLATLTNVVVNMADNTRNWRVFLAAAADAGSIAAPAQAPAVDSMIRI
ncbi:type III secretion system chaperone [Prosthecomicrobium hirschii]|jgi:hypothetical protein|uniref:Type III secretion system chaperone n=1 Tax=Prosthecodimorpha hirschii TaxID=665126 RepID=A0A0P6WCY4_9HYPH|nr:type III secretion system chaperone [Prosthecomicrobium hirschii]KPL52568.1 hypothetical protein ABB55_10305 [Prosthecomicrobium hirschii]MCW1841428.1 type III secretion system chaperone [Prosthecomicrobium hirschii]